MYQAQHPDRYLTPENVVNNGNVFIEDGTIVDANTPLLPFRKDAGSFWTTNDIRDTAVFGYIYPETQRSNFASDEVFQAAVTASVSQLYGGSVRAMFSAQEAKAGPQLKFTRNRTFTDWLINTQASALDLPPTFVTRFSLTSGSSLDDVAEVGMWSILVPMHHNKKKRAIYKAERGIKHVTTPQKTLQGSVSLTASLLDAIAAGKLNSLEPADVVPFLQERLIWKVYSVCELVLYYIMGCLLADSGLWQNDP